MLTLESVHSFLNELFVSTVFILNSQSRVITKSRVFTKKKQFFFRHTTITMNTTSANNNFAKVNINCIRLLVYIPLVNLPPIFFFSNKEYSKNHVMG